jgi:ribosome-associated protein
VRDKVQENGGKVYGVEGEKGGEWVLVDLGEIVVHLMHPTVRSFYNLEEVWGGKEVKVKAADPAVSTLKKKAKKKPTRAKAARRRRRR